MNKVRVFGLSLAGIGALTLSTDDGLHLIVIGVVVFILTFINPGGSDVSKRQ